MQAHPKAHKHGPTWLHAARHTWKQGPISQVPEQDTSHGIACTGPSGIAPIEPWRIGSVRQLAPDEDIPLVGVVRPGQALLTAETGMFRAPAAAHKPLATDFLLVR